MVLDCVPQGRGRGRHGTANPPEQLLQQGENCSSCQLTLRAPGHSKGHCKELVVSWKGTETSPPCWALLDAQPQPPAVILTLQ